MRLALTLAAVLGLLAPAPWASPIQEKPHQERIFGPGEVFAWENVEPLALRARSVVEAHLGIEFGDAAKARFTDARELRRLFEADLLPQMKAVMDDPDAAAEVAEQSARVYAIAALGKFTFETGEVLVAPENFERMAELLDAPELLDSDVIYAVLVHEYVHAAQEKLYAWTEKANTVKDTSALQALNALVEGHAQHVTRTLCTEAAEREGFEIFTRCIGAVPETDDALERQLMEIAAATVATAYYDGERFAAKVAASGEGAIARAFASPPDAVELIFRPEWYLDPASRPKERFDLAATLATLKRSFVGPQFVHQDQAFLEPQVRAACALVAGDDLDLALAAFRRGHVQIISSTQVAGDMIMPALMEMATPADAGRMFDLEKRLLHAKDAQFGEGELVQIRDVAYRDVNLGPLRGLLGTKTVVGPGMEIDTIVFVAARGPLVIELVIQGSPLTPDETVALGAELLERALFPGDFEDTSAEEGAAREDGEPAEASRGASELE